ncbi:MAG: hypothetical protein WBG82_04975 [Parvibaculum sp.]|uniref:hypothetical protein n=1 Tax=Parvibaculum sp. TaxID=2024848 RepID=UPI003C784162
MPSKELIEKVENIVLEAMFHGSHPRNVAETAISTILAALQDPTDEMVCAVDHDDCATPDNAQRAWRKMLNASPLGEQSE